MVEIAGSLWENLGLADVLIVPTNGRVRRDGEAVMGAGLALAVKERWPSVANSLGYNLTAHGNHVHILALVKKPGLAESTKMSDHMTIVSFPTKDHWKDPSDLGLIAGSVLELRTLADKRPDWKRIVLPRVGCGRGGLTWETVRPLLEGLDDRFFVIHPLEEDQ